MHNTIGDILASWGIVRVDSVTIPTSGVMNETFVCDTDRGSVVLRGHRRTIPSQVQFEHVVMDHARSKGIPVPAALDASDGERIVHINGRMYSLFEHANGVQLEHGDLTPDIASEMGATLATLQDALVDLPFDRAAATLEVPLDQRTPERIAALIAHIEALPVQSDVEAWAVQALRGHSAALPDLPSAPPKIRHEEVQIIHSDYQNTNLFFEDGQISAIIDWDKACPGVTSGEVVRTMELALSLRPELCRPFLNAYRSIKPLSDEALNDAVEAYGWWDCHSLWLYEASYQQGQDRVKRWIAPGGFTPFAKRWASAGIS